MYNQLGGGSSRDNILILKRENLVRENIKYIPGTFSTYAFSPWTVAINILKDI